MYVQHAGKRLAKSLQPEKSSKPREQHDCNRHQKGHMCSHRNCVGRYRRRRYRVTLVSGARIYRVVSCKLRQHRHSVHRRHVGAVRNWRRVAKEHSREGVKSAGVRPNDCAVAPGVCSACIVCNHAGASTSGGPVQSSRLRLVDAPSSRLQKCQVGCAPPVESTQLKRPLDGRRLDSVDLTVIAST